MILLLEGETSTTKSTIMYTAPLPMVVFAFDAGAVRALKGAKWKLFEGIDIDIIQYPMGEKSKEAWVQHWCRNNGRAITIYLMPAPLQTSWRLQGVRALWNTFVKLFNMAAQAPEIRTIGIDTLTIGRSIANDAYLEDLQNSGEGNRKKLIEIEYTTPNGWVREVYQTIQNIAESFETTGYQKHLIVTHHLRPVRMDANVNGETKSVIQMVRNPDGSFEAVQEMEGLRGTYRFVDIALRMEKFKYQDPTEAMVQGKRPEHTGVRGVFRKCGYDLSLEWSYILAPTWDSLARKVSTNVHPDAKIEQRGQINTAAKEQEAESEKQVIDVTPESEKVQLEEASGRE